MPRRVSAKAKIAAVAILLLALVIFIFAIKSAREKVELRVTKVQQLPNGSTAVTIVLTNGTKRKINVVDDGLGGPWVALDSGGRNPTRVTPGSNTLQLNLAAAASLTNTVVLSNPPTRFRLLTYVRNLDAENRAFRFVRLLPFLPAERSTYLQWQLYRVPPPTTGWIEIPMKFTPGDSFSP